MNNKQIYYKQLIKRKLDNTWSLFVWRNNGGLQNHAGIVSTCFRICFLFTFLFFFTCNRDHSNFKPNYSENFGQDDLQYYVDTNLVFDGLKKVRNLGQKIDSLIALADKLKNYREDVALVYGKKAQFFATKDNRNFSRGISSYYTAMLKGRKAWLFGEGIEDAFADAKISKTLLSRYNEEEWNIKINNLMGIFFYRESKLDSADYYLNLALTDLKKSLITGEKKKVLEGEILHDLANLYFKEDSTSTKALIYFKSAFPLYKETNHFSSLARLRNDLGKYYYINGEFNLADSLISANIAYAKEYKDTNSLVDTYQRFGVLRKQQYHTQKEKDELLSFQALNYFRECLKFQKENLFFTYHMMGQTFQDRASFEKSYIEIDSAIHYFKLGIEGARIEGANGAIVKMVREISTLCDYRSKYLIDEDSTHKKDCLDLLGSTTIKFINKNYQGIIETMKSNIGKANERFRLFERLELEASARQKETIQLIISGGILIITLLVFLLLLLRQQKKRLNAKMEALRAQINPHFISNSLNAIESLVNLDKKEAAAKYLIHFSRLSRRILNSSREGSASLAEELETLKHFLALEQLRFRDKLQYQIHISDDIDPEQVEIPAMILQPYAENAIWHGIKPKMEKGLLKIEARREGKYIQIIIEDDGVGRAKSAAMKAASVLQQNSVGMKINQERLHVMGRAKGAKVEIIDLFDENGQANGTKVVLRLPYKQITKK